MHTCVLKCGPSGFTKNIVQLKLLLSKHLFITFQCNASKSIYTIKVFLLDISIGFISIGSNQSWMLPTCEPGFVSDPPVSLGRIGSGAQGITPSWPRILLMIQFVKVEIAAHKILSSVWNSHPWIGQFITTILLTQIIWKRSFMKNNSLLCFILVIY